MPIGSFRVISGHYAEFRVASHVLGRTRRKKIAMLLRSSNEVASPPLSERGECLLTAW